MNKEKYFLFHEELRCIINKLSLENGSDTPDYILADFLIGCLKQFNETMARRNSHKDLNHASKPTNISARI